MANLHNYTIQFVSLRAETLYTLTIGGSSGSTIALKGGAQPFSTQEDDNEDLFTPIRTQSGYIRIVDDGFAADGITPFDWKDLLPETDTDRPVTLTDDNGNVVWQGYMQAQTFSGTLYGNPQQRDFPVQCPLSVLSASDVNSTNRQLKNFAYIIKQAFDNLPGITISSFVFQGGSKARAMLMKIVDWQNLVVEDSGSITGRYDNYQVMTDVCAFWGWSCRMFGETVYFSCPDDSNLPYTLLLTPTQLNTMADGVSAGTVSGDFLSLVSLSGDIFATTNNDDALVRGYHKAIVSAEGNDAGKDVMSAFPESVVEEMRGLGTYTEVYVPGSIRSYFSNDLTAFASSFLEGECTTGRGSFNLMKNYNNSSTGNVTKVIRIKKTYSSSLLCAKMNTTFGHVYQGTGQQQFGSRPAGVQLRATAYVRGEQFQDFTSPLGAGSKSMYICFGIGSGQSVLWFQGNIANSWSSTKTAFKVTLGNEGDLLFVRSHESGNDFLFSLISFPTDVNLNGQVYVEFLGSDDMPEYDGDRSFELVGFSVQMSYDDSTLNAFGEEKSINSTRKYVASNGSRNDQEFTADLIYSSDENLPTGYGLVINEDYSIMTGFAFDGSTAEHPEQHLANRVAAWGASSKRKISAELRTDITGTITPRNKIELDGSLGYPISISHDWRDDVTIITNLEL